MPQLSVSFIVELDKRPFHANMISWALNPGSTAVRTLVRDRLTGRYGSLEMPL
jgi:hypothetical protein